MNETVELPRKPQLSIKEAALEIGCTEADVRYFISIGKLRNAIESRHIKYDRMTSLSDLFELPGLTHLQSIDTRSEEAWKSVQLSSRELAGIELLQEAPKYLYVFSEAFHRSRAKPENNQPWTCVFAAFDNQPVFLLSISEGFYRFVGKAVGEIVEYEDGIQILEPAIISREELDRFLKIYGTNSIDSLTESKADKLANKRRLFNPFTKPCPCDNAAEVICDLGNKLVAEKKLEKPPTETQLLDYILSSGAYVSREVKRNEYKIEGVDVDKRGFKRRYKNYLQHYHEQNSNPLPKTD